MTSFSPWILIWILLIIDCSNFSVTNPVTFTKPNPEDRLPLEDIIMKNDLQTYFYVIHPKTMKAIFSGSYCGEKKQNKFTGNIEHHLNMEKNSDNWTGACGTDQETIRFFSPYLNQPSLIEKIYEESQNALLDARKFYQVGRLSDAKEKFTNTIEWEPSQPEARLGLFILHFKDKECDKSLRNYKIIMSLKLAYPREQEIQKEFRNQCKSILPLGSLE